jgi:hypothetical protein
LIGPAKILATSDKIALRFEAEMAGAGKFRVLLRELGKGEYAFLPPGASGHPGASSVDRMYTFGIC